jgi:hypothetical protein
LKVATSQCGTLSFRAAALAPLRVCVRFDEAERIDQPPLFYPVARCLQQAQPFATTVASDRAREIAAFKRLRL